MLVTLKKKQSMVLWRIFKRLQKCMWQSHHNQKPLPYQDKIFQFAHDLGQRYGKFQFAILTKPPYPSFS